MKHYTWAETSALTDEQRAANGAALLDEQGPLGWRSALDDSMDMMFDCVLDRVFGDYLEGKGHPRSP